MPRRPGMWIVVCGTVMLFAATMSSWQQPAPPGAATRPNVILIMTDDMGYADLGSYGATDIKTPNLDRLARDGARLTDARRRNHLVRSQKAASRVNLRLRARA